MFYGGKGDNKIPAPGAPEESEFVFESRSTGDGPFDTIDDPNPDDDINPYVVTVLQAADGSGKVELDKKEVFAGSTDNTFNITYTAVGRMNGGKIQLTVPSSPWTALSEDSWEHKSADSTGVISDEKFTSSDRVVTYTIDTLEAGETLKFAYKGVTVQPTLSRRC